MKNGLARALVTILIAGNLGCSNGASPADQTAVIHQALTVIPAVRLSELHYDNAGADVGEAIEVSGPAGTDVTGWQVVLYNGTGGASYNTQTLSDTIPATCGGRGVLVLSYPTNGIQNGGTTTTGTTDPDGVALVDAGGTVVEFLSYEGTFAAANGPAVGRLSVDIGVRELGTEAPGQSLQRSNTGAWAGPAPSTFGSCNDADVSPPPPPPDVASVTVAPSAATLAIAATQVFVATAFDAANQLIAGTAFAWTSSAPSVATVDGSGLVTAVAAGDATITATAANSLAGSATVHVSAPPPPPPLSDTRVSELHYDNAGTDVGEAIEIEGPAGADLTGFSVVLYDGNGGTVYNTQTLSGPIPATCGARGVVVINYPTNGIQNGSPDGLALVDAGGVVIEFLSYEGTFTATNGPAAAMQSVDIGVAESSSAPLGQSLSRDAAGVWQVTAASFGACNGTGAPPPPPANHISFTGRLPGDPPLPVGFQDQLFATVHDANNVVVASVITWSSDTPAIASIDADGVMTALAEGTATFRATADDGITTAVLSLPMSIAVASTTAQYAGNAEFGEPTDADPSDDFIVRHPEYTASFNPTRGSPNWVSYDLDASDFGPEDRCDCFTFDPALPATFTHYTTADYTGAGAFHGYGIDRGHLTRSFDRTSASLDNAFTFYFTNVVPQASDLNQGPWAALENDLGDLARVSNKEVYIIAGVAGSKGTLKNQGNIVIPARTWKVAVILPRDHGLRDIVDYRDLSVIAVDMPNEPGVRNVPWQTYQTTVAAIEALSGYDLLALLPDKIENIVSQGIEPPIAAVDGPYAAAEGGTITMSAAGSVDPNGTVVSYTWTFGDGTTTTTTTMSGGPTVSHTFARYGVYDVSVIVTDNDGLTDSIATTATVSDVVPVIGALPAATLVAGQTYAATGSFVDPGADVWTGTVDFGDGAGQLPMALNGTDFSLSHVYETPGTFTVTVQIADGNATATGTTTVTVTPAAKTINDAIAVVDQLINAHKVSRGVGALLKAELALASVALNRNNAFVAVLTLSSVEVELKTLVALRLLSPADAGPLTALIAELIHGITGG
ncbi:MAG TPA: DNA/RNA non-specific endonuclease [Polyangia bacterium]|jgi:DNA/RNA endonuclease G (NUC1)/PKD repeat protein